MKCYGDCRADTQRGPSEINLLLPDGSLRLFIGRETFAAASLERELGAVPRGIGQPHKSKYY